MTASAEFRDGLLASIPSLRAFAYSLIGRTDRADDLVQETLTKAWAHQQSFQPGTNQKAWLYTILRNEFYSQMRKKGREVEDVDGAYSRNLGVHPEQHGHLDMADMRTRSRADPGRSARGAAPRRGVRLLLRGSGGNLRRRRRDHQKPCQPRAQPPGGNPRGERGQRVRARRDERGGDRQRRSAVTEITSTIPEQIADILRLIFLNEFENASCTSCKIKQNKGSETDHGK